VRDRPGITVPVYLTPNYDALVTDALERVGNVATFLARDVDKVAAFMPLRKAGSIGRPIGDADWIEALEARTGRTLAPAKRGPKVGSSGVK